MGKRLQKLRQELLDVAQLLNDYPINGPAQRLARRTYEALDLLRCKLDGMFAREHPGEFDPSAYYGGDRGGG